VKRLSLTLILLLFVLAACSSRRVSEFGGGGNLSQVQVLVRALDAQISLEKGAVAFDLRDYTQWSQGHLPGARSITLEDLKMGRGLPDDKSAPLLFYGDGVLDQSAEDAAELAFTQGYQRVQYFPGGWRAWTGQTAVD